MADFEGDATIRIKAVDDSRPYHAGFRRALEDHQSNKFSRPRRGGFVTPVLCNNGYCTGGVLMGKETTEFAGRLQDIFGWITGRFEPSDRRDFAYRDVHIVVPSGFLFGELVKKRGNRDDRLPHGLLILVAGRDAALLKVFS